MEIVQPFNPQGIKPLDLDGDLNLKPQQSRLSWLKAAGIMELAASCLVEVS